MNITKIKWKNGRMHLEYSVERERGKDPDEYTMTCAEAPRPAFEDAFSQLASCMAKEAELPTAMIPELKPAGVSISYYDDGRWGVVISGVRALKKSNVPLVLNTPHKPAEGSHGETVSIVEDLIREAEAYIKGDRAQGSLALGDAE